MNIGILFYKISKSIKKALLASCEKEIFNNANKHQLTLINSLLIKNIKSSNSSFFALSVAKSRLHNKTIDKLIIICQDEILPFMYFTKFNDIVAAVTYDVSSTITTVEHNNSNVLILNVDSNSDAKLIAIIKAFLSTEYQNGRHQYRLDMLTKGVK